jgi:hypothetical protein
MQNHNFPEYIDSVTTFNSIYKRKGHLLSKQSNKLYTDTQILHNYLT